MAFRFQESLAREHPYRYDQHTPDRIATRETQGRQTAAYSGSSPATDRFARCRREQTSG
jgi:hypothetical protein